MNGNDNSSPAPAGGAPAPAPSSPAPKPTKTPMFQAMHADRYLRQAHIKRIEEKTGRCLTCYISGPSTSIDRDDILGFVDLLHNAPRGKNLDLILHTGGGDIDAAEKLSALIRTTVGDAQLRIIVPDYAKSAGTMIAVGADNIVMGDTSELGPIDPQIVLSDQHGNRIQHSVQSYLDAYQAHTEALKRDPGDVAAQIMLGKLDPSTVKTFEAVRNRARLFAEQQLRQWMFRNQTGPVTQIADNLIDTHKWLSHGQVIGWQDATQIGLKVEHLPQTDAIWQEIWHLYCLQRLAIKDRQKLFESAYASLQMDA
jgi:ATP-dependent protease ClpP protease subunit